MKLWVKLLLAMAPSFGAGFAAGYFFRKKQCEIAIEPIDESEMNKIIEEELKKEEAKTEESPSEMVQKDIPAEQTTEVKIDTQKEAYFKRWKAEEAAEKYNTTTKEVPDDVVMTEEGLDIPDIEDEKEMLAEDDDEIPPGRTLRLGIEERSIEDWNRYLSQPDGPYDTIELKWYSNDDVLCEDDGDDEEPLEDSQKYMGFDVEEAFKRIVPDTTGDPDVRVVLNRKTKTFYYITKVEASYRRKKRHEEYGSDGYDDDEDESDDIYDRFHK